MQGPPQRPCAAPRSSAMKVGFPRRPMAETALGSGQRNRPPLFQGQTLKGRKAPVNPWFFRKAHEPRFVSLGVKLAQFDAAQVLVQRFGQNLVPGNDRTPLEK